MKYPTKINAHFKHYLGSDLGKSYIAYVTSSHEISLKLHFGYFVMCIILKTAAPVG